MITSGTKDFDDDDSPGNDSSATNFIVRSFDTVKYNAVFNTLTVNKYNTYKHAYLWVEIDLPCTRDIASIDTTVFSTDVRQAKAPYEIEKDGTIHTIYTFYYEKRTTIEDDGTVNHAIPQLGFFPFTMKVFGAKNGTHIKPVVGMAVAQLELGADGNPKKDKNGYYIVARDYSDFAGAYDVPKYAEGPDVQVSAKPGFNVDINPTDVFQQATSKVYDFSTGNDKALDKDAGMVFGRAVKFGINVSMRNEDVSKGLKGLELPDGNPITFELDFSANFEGQAIDSPLIWDVSRPGYLFERGASGSWKNKVTRVPADKKAGTDFKERTGPSVDLWNGGDWAFERLDNGKIKVTISNYIVNPLWFPTGYNSSTNAAYYFFSEGKGGPLKYGVFAGRNIDIVVPFGSNICDEDGNPRPEGTKPEYVSSIDDPNYYPNLYNREGNISIQIKDSLLDATSQSNQNTLVLYPGDKNGQTLYTNADDVRTAKVKLILGASFDRSIQFAHNTASTTFDVNSSTYATGNGKDAVMPGRVISIYGSNLYTHRDTYKDSWIYAAQVLIKFDDEHLTPTGELRAGQLYAVKPDGKGWESDEEMKQTGIEELVYYKSLADLKASGKVCVGVLREWEEEAPTEKKNQNFASRCYNLLVTSDKEKYNTVSMTSMCSRMWQKDAYDKIVKINGSFPSYADSEVQGKTIEGYLTGKYDIDEEDLEVILPVRDDLKAKGNLAYRKSSYDEDGFHAGNGGETSWGDSLYIVPYMMKVRKYVEQKNGPTSDDSVGYSFENREHIADFCIVPYFNMPSTTPELLESNATTTVTVSDILPAGLTYITGSAYIGGTYHNDTVNRGGHGYIEGGKQVEPIIEELAKGETLLTWELEDVKIGDNDAIPCIHLSAEIDQEIEKHTEWINTARVKSIEDNRPYSEYSSVGNVNTAKINAAPSGNFITKKIPDSIFHDRDEELIWTLRWKNTTLQEYPKMVLTDVMPYDGDPRGSKISGKYKITDLKYTFAAGTTASNYRFYYTTDEKGRESNPFDAELPYDDFVGESPIVNGMVWKKADLAADGSVSELVGKYNVVAFTILCDVPSMAEVRAVIKIKPENCKPGDVFTNAIVAGKMLQGSTVHIIQRGIRGTIWNENSDSIDGERQSKEKKVSGVKVVLKIKKGETYEEYATTTTDKNGRYEFLDLPAGTFKIEFVNTGDTDLRTYRATEALKEGVHSYVNSDGQPIYGEEVFAEINDIVMPESKDMRTSPYFVEHQDLGLIRHDLSVSKYVDPTGAEDEEAELDREFIFKLTVAEGVKDSEEFEVLDGEGTSLGTVTGKELKEGYEFTLKHGKVAKFIALPVDSKYTIKEYDYEGNCYGYKQSLLDGSDELTGVLDQDKQVKVKNTFVEPELTEIKVTKEWKDEEAGKIEGYTRPYTITATLLKNGEKDEQVVLSDENNWTHTFSNLPKYDREPWPTNFDDKNGEINYEIQETLNGEESFVEVNGERRFYVYDDKGSITGYFRYDVTEDEETGNLIITNTFVPATEEEKGSISFFVKKVDEEGEVITDNPATFQLVNNETQDVIVAETKAEDGIAKFVVSAAGKYTLTEKDAPNGYEKTDKEFTVIVERDGRKLTETSEEKNLNSFETIFKVSADGDWDEDTLTLTVANKKEEEKEEKEDPTEETVGDASFYIKKVDENGEVITGNPAIFEVYKEGTNEVIVGDTGDDGIAKFTISEVGRYTIKEKQAPIGYKKTSEEYTLVIEDGGRVLVEEDKEANKNIFNRIFNLIFGGDNWDAETLTLTVVNEKLKGELSLSKQVDKNVVKAGDILNYDIIVTNISDITIRGAEVWDKLPEQFAYLSDDSKGVYGVEDGFERIMWTVDKLEPGESKTFRLSVLVKECTNKDSIVNVAYAKIPKAPGLPSTWGKDPEPEVFEDEVKVNIEKTSTVPITVVKTGNRPYTGDENNVFIWVMVLALAAASALILRRQYK